MLLTTRKEKIAFAGRVFTLLSDSVSVTNIWRYQIFKENKYVNLGVPEGNVDSDVLGSIIWFCSMYDSLQARDRILNELIETAEENNLDNQVKWCREAEKLFSLISNLLSTFTKEEQVYMQRVRDVVVHGWLHAPHNDVQTIKYLVEDVFTVEKTGKEIIAEMTIPLFSKGWAISVRELMPRFLEKQSDLWKKLDHLSLDKELFHREIYADIGIDI